MPKKFKVLRNKDIRCRMFFSPDKNGNHFSKFPAFKGGNLEKYCNG